jgi:hypothetical protein
MWYKEKRKCEGTLYGIINGMFFPLKFFSLSLNWMRHIQSTRNVGIVYSEFRLNFPELRDSLLKQKISLARNLLLLLLTINLLQSCSNSYWRRKEEDTCSWPCCKWAPNWFALWYSSEFSGKVKDFLYNLINVSVFVCVRMDYIEPIHRLKCPDFWICLRGNFI